MKNITQTLNRAAAAIALSLVVTAAKPANAIPIENKCDEPVYIAYLTIASKDRGEYQRIITKGWFPVPARGEVELLKDFTHVLVMKNGAILSSTNLNDVEVRGGCIRTGKKFDRDIVSLDNYNQAKESNHPVSECLFEPGVAQLEGQLPAHRWYPFHKYQGYSKYTVPFSACKNVRNPDQTRLAWKPEEGDAIYSWYWQRDYRLAVGHVIGGNKKEPLHIRSLKENPDWVILNQPPGKQNLALGKTSRKLQAENGWENVGKGKWID